MSLLGSHVYPNAPSRDWLVARGEVADLIRRTDWSNTPLGPRDRWSESMRAVVNLVLASRCPMALLWGRELRLLYNDAYRAVAGGRHPAALGRPTSEVWPEIWRINEPLVRAVIERGEAVFMEEALFPIDRRGKREDAYFTLCYSPVHDARGEIVAALLTFQETTRQTTERTRLARERERALDAFEHGDAAYVLDSEFRYVLVNQAYETLSHKLRSETVGRRMWDIFPETAAPELRFWDSFHRVTRERIAIHFEEYFAPLDLWVEVHAYPTSEGGVACIVRRINERKQAEIELRESSERAEMERRRLAAVLDALPAGVAIADAHGKILQFNEALVRIWGRPPIPQSVDDYAEWRGRWLDTGEPLRANEWAMARALATASPALGDVIEIDRFDGGQATVINSAAPILDREGHVVGGVTASVDITAQIIAEKALREADRRKDEFLAMLSHELRNPLAPIRNSLYVLERADPGGPQARRAHEIIARQVTHLTRLVDDLLDVTRISRGKIHLQRERVELCDLVHRAAEDHRSLFEAHGIELETFTGVPPIWADADATRIAQVIGNLLTNAVKFTPSGGRVSLALESTGTEAVIRIHDTGQGISPEILPRLFQPFVQADATIDRSKGGLGLGLALVKALVDLHGGSVRASSDGLGKGAEFVVRIPLHESAPPHVSEVPQPPRDARMPASVLVIEDNSDAAETLKEALEISGHEVQTAATGPEGIEKARSMQPAVVLCDIGLPGMDGYEVARALRADPALSDTPLIALSGYAAPEDVERSQRAGFTLHLAKPPDLETLERTVNQIVKRRAG